MPRRISGLNEAIRLLESLQKDGLRVNKPLATLKARLRELEAEFEAEDTLEEPNHQPQGEKPWE